MRWGGSVASISVSQASTSSNLPLPISVPSALGNGLQDGKYDRLLRLLYDDIQKYEAEVPVDSFAASSTALSPPASLCKASHLQLPICCRER